MAYELTEHWTALPVEFPLSVEELYDLAMRLPDDSEVMVEADAWRRVQLKARRILAASLRGRYRRF